MAPEANVLSGYVSDVKGGRIRVQIDMGADDYIEIPAGVVECAWQPADHREPTLFVLQSLDGITRNGEELSDESPAEPDPIVPIMALRRATNNGGGGGADKCADARVTCEAGCSDNHPSSKDSPHNLNGMMREACLDSCAAAERTCRWHGPGSFGGGGIFIA
jgi:hypothetical protein